MNTITLNEQIQNMRRELNEAVSNKKTLDKNEILEYSQKLDKLIVKYYSEVYKSKGLQKAIV